MTATKIFFFFSFLVITFTFNSFFFIRIQNSNLLKICLSPPQMLLDIGVVIPFEQRILILTLHSSFKQWGSGEFLEIELLHFAGSRKHPLKVNLFIYLWVYLYVMYIDKATQLHTPFVIHAMCDYQ